MTPTKTRKVKKLLKRNGTTTLTICTINLIAKSPLKKGYPSNPTSYGGYMRQERMDCGFTQSDLANIFGVYKSTVDKWERGATSPNEDNRNKIIEFLGYDPINSTII